MKIIKWRVATSCKFVMSKNSAKHQLVNETLELETETIKIRSGDRRAVETDTSSLVHGRDRTVRTWSSTREDHDRRGLTALDYTAQGNGVLMYSVCGRCEKCRQKVGVIYFCWMFRPATRGSERADDPRPSTKGAKGPFRFVGEGKLTVQTAPNLVSEFSSDGCNRSAMNDWSRPHSQSRCSSSSKEVQLLWCNNWVRIHWKYVGIKPELWCCRPTEQSTDRSQYRYYYIWLQTLRIRADTVVDSVFQLGVSMPSTTASSLLLFGFGTNSRLLSLCPFHWGLQVSIAGHPGDSDLNLETFVLFLSHIPARFYLSVELGFIVCFLHFMRICHARHYSTLRNVHYWKRRRRRRR